MAIYFDSPPTSLSKVLPPVIISKVTLSPGKVEPRKNADLSPHIKNTSNTNTKYGTSDTMLKVRVDLSVFQTHLLLNDEYRSRIKIYLLEEADGSNRLTSYGIDPQFTNESLKLQNGKYCQQCLFQIPTSMPTSLKYTAWVGLDDNNENDSVGYTQGPKNTESIINSSHVSKYISYGDRTSKGNNGYDHYHVVKVDENGNGTAESGGPFNVRHKHNIVNGQIEENAGHSHNLRSLMSVVDNRIFNDAARLDVAVVERQDVDIRKHLHPSLLKSNELVDKYNAYSDLWHTTDNQGAIRAGFALDVNTMVRKESLCNAIYTPENINNGILDTFKPVIKDIRVYRQRIKGSSNNDSRPLDVISSQFKDPVYGTKSEKDSVGGYQKFNNNSADEMVVMSAQVENSLTISENTKRESINSNPNSIKEVRQITPTAGIRFISFVDRSFNEKNEGYYRYKINVSIYDPSLKIINSHISTLQSSIDAINEYSLFVKNGPKQIINPFGQSATDSSDKNSKIKSSKKTIEAAQVLNPERSSVPSEKVGFTKQEIVQSGEQHGSMSKKFTRDQYVPGIYNENINMFSEVLYNNPVWSSENRVDRVGPRLEGAVQDYLKVLSFYVSNGIPPDVNSKSLYNIISPKFGSPEGIEHFLNLMQNLQEKIQSFRTLEIKSDMRKVKDSSTDKNNLSVSKSRKNLIIESEHIFSEAIAADNFQNSGFDFLALGSNDSMGLKEISRSTLNNKADYETRKIFTSLTADTSMGKVVEFDNVSTTKYSYFTPTNITMGSSVSMTNNSDTPSYGNSYQFSRVAIMTDVSKRNTPINTAAGSFASSKFKLASRSNGTSCDNTQYDTTPLNALEKSYMGDNNVISEEVKNSELLGDFFGLSGITVVKRERDLPQDIKEASSSPRADASQEYEKNDLKNINNRDILRVGNPVLNSIRSDQSTTNSNLMNYSLSDNTSNLKKSLNDWQISSQTPSQHLRNSPNQIKALIKLNSDAKNSEAKNPFREDVVKFLSEGITESNADEFRYKFQTINKLEVLVSYNGVKRSGPNQVAQTALPVWQILTKDILEENKGRNLLARLTPYEDKVLQVKRDKNYELQTYDQYFIIKGN